jgi:hypothetical protein
MSRYATLTLDDRTAIRARVHKLSAHEAVVATSEYLPRESHCELAFKATAEKLHIVAMCKVREVVHSSMGFLLFLRVVRLPKQA